MSARTILESLVAASENTVAAVAVKATLAMLAAFLVIRVLRGASASLRHLVAAATFGVLLLLPVAGMLVPARVVRLAPAPAPQNVPHMARPAAPTGGSSALTAPPIRRRPMDAMRVAYALYVLGAAGFAASLLAGIVRLRRVHSRAEVSVAGTRLANETARRQGMPGGIEVAVSSELAVPVTFGWGQPVILLPVETTAWDEHELGRAIRHELEHIARADWATHVVSRLALALYWPHPFAWQLWRRLRLEAERACDDAVIRSHGQPESYAEQLVALARRLHGKGAVPALSMATRSNLGLRVEAILDGRQRRAPRSRLLSVAVAAGAMAWLWAVAPFQVLSAAVPVADEAMASDDGDDDEDEGDPLDMALLKAAERGDLGRMQRLLDQGAKADAILRGDGSPLIGAARGGRVPAMEMLIAAGADVNRGVRGDGSPLIMAAKRGHLEAVRLLLDRGADIDLGVPGDGNALIMAAGDGHVDVVRFLLDRGAAIEKVVPGDENALIHASESGQADVVRLLLDRGADVNARVWADGPNREQGEWRTALSMARRNGHEEVVRILRAAGARE